MTYYFYQEDLDKLDEQIQDLTKKLRATHQDTAESTQQSSETWHDNFGFEEGQRQLTMLSGRLAELSTVRKMATVVSRESGGTRVRMGSAVLVRDEATGKEQTVRIGSYMSLADKEVVSYVSPVAKLLIGAEVGETREGQVGPAGKVFKVLAIS